MKTDLLLVLILFQTSLGVLALEPGPEDYTTVEALRLYNISVEKREKYIEVDSIHLYLTWTKKISEQIGFDSLTFMVNNDLIYWNWIETDGRSIPGLIAENKRINEKLKNKKWENAIRVNYVNYLITQNDSLELIKDSVETILGKVLQEARVHEDYVHFMVASHTLADYYMNAGLYDEPIEQLLRRSLEYRDKDKETRLIQNDSHGLLGKYFLAIKEFDQAIDHMSRLPIVDYGHGNFRWVYSQLAQAYFGAGDFKNAYLTNLKSEAYADSLANINRNLAIQRAKYAYDTEQKEKMITQLQENARLRELSTQKQRKFIVFTLIATAIIIGLLIILIRNYKRKSIADQALIDAQNEMSQVKAQFFTNITHEFRTPLTVILGMANKIKGNQREKELIRNNGQQLLDMVNQMMDLSKSELKSLELKCIQDDIIKYLRYLTESFETLALKNGTKLTFYAESNEIMMDFDPSCIKHILSNLVSNAIKFTGSQGQVVIHVKQEHDQLLLIVQDNGIGMPTEELSKIFDRFYQINSPEHQISGGTGIGLSLVKELIDLMNGKINVSSQPGQGSTMSVSIPITNRAQIRHLSLDPIHENLETEQHAKSYWVNQDQNRIALVIEDNLDVQYYIESCIQHLYKVERALNGKEGIEKATELIPDIIISDVMMPSLNGYQLTEQLKGDYRTNHIPVILLTAKAGVEDKITGLDHGADAYLTKPFIEEELLVRMKNLIELRQNLRERYTQEQSYQHEINHQDPFMHKLIETLNENYQNEQFGVNELAQAMNLSRMQVHRKLKAITNLSTSKFMNQFRLEKASISLKNSTMNISEIAYSHGFSDPKYFSKLFAKQFGITPSDMRS